VYVLYVDESGAHGLENHNEAYVLAGVAIHERDIPPLGRALHDVVEQAIAPGERPERFELHAAELWHPGHDSAWHGRRHRHVLDHAIDVVSGFREGDPGRPMRLIVEVLPPGTGREHEAYGRLLNRFDDWLPAGELGFVVSDVSGRAREIQDWAARWREAAGPWGRLERLAEVPLFADSKASRLLQAADLVAWASWRRFGGEPHEARWWRTLAHRADAWIAPGAGR
jgi:hypothetical protein